jgi:hypothetical protein
MSIKASVAAALVLAGCVADMSENGDELQGETRPHGGLHVPKGFAGKPGGTVPMSYHGGPVIEGTVNVYTIWYGTWSSSSAPQIVSDYMNNIGGSPWFRINTGYSDGSGPVSGNVANGGSTTAPVDHGKNLTDTNIQSIVGETISAGLLPQDTNGIYFVITSADVMEGTPTRRGGLSGFCDQYCGWHDHGTIGGGDVKYAFVGNPNRCPTSCQQQTTGPNGVSGADSGADGMISIISHEMAEATTDPDLNAWYDRNGNENADKCAWTFGTTYTAANGSKANVSLGGRDYLIQQNWLNATNVCGLHL